MTNLNELSKQIYEANKLKGFDAKNENIGQTLMLIVSELSEALEALRKNRRANLELYDHNTTNNGLEFELAFQVEIKDTFEVIPEAAVSANISINGLLAAFLIII